MNQDLIFMDARTGVLNVLIQRAFFVFMSSSPHNKVQNFKKTIKQNQKEMDGEPIAVDSSVIRPKSPSRMRDRLSISYKYPDKKREFSSRFGLGTTLTLFFAIVLFVTIGSITNFIYTMNQIEQDEADNILSQIENSFQSVLKERISSFEAVGTSFNGIVDMQKEGKVAQKVFDNMASGYLTLEPAVESVMLMIPTLDADKAGFEGQSFSETVPTYQQEGQNTLYYFPIRYRMLGNISPHKLTNTPLSKEVIQSPEMTFSLYEAVQTGKTVVSPFFSDYSESMTSIGTDMTGGGDSSRMEGQNRYIWVMKALYTNPENMNSNRLLSGILAIRLNLKVSIPPDFLKEGQMITVTNSPSVPYANMRLTLTTGRFSDGKTLLSSEPFTQHNSRVQLKDMQFPFTAWMEKTGGAVDWLYIGLLIIGGMGLVFFTGTICISMYGHSQKVNDDRNQATSLITKQQQEIQEGEKKFKHLIESTNVIPWAADLNTKSFSYVGPQIEEITGYSGMTWLTTGYWVHHLHPDDRSSVLYHFPEFQEGKMALREYRVRKSDGSTMWVRNSIACADPLVKGNSLVPRHIHGFMVDITEQKLAQEQLVRARDQQLEANKTKSEFLANMSHELRTPLNAIIGFAEIMKGEIFGHLGSPKYTEYVNSIYGSGKHLLDLINDILDLSKIEAGRFELQEEDIDLGDLLKSCYMLLAERAKNAGQQFVFELPPEIPILTADSRRLKQIMINLLSNAIKFTKMGGTVRLVTKVSLKNGLYIAVSDTGIGIKPEDLPKVFEKFSQVDSDLSRQHDGTGLGLPIARSLIELHGGTLKLESVYGEGTTVSLWLPSKRLQERCTPNPMKGFDRPSEHNMAS